MNVRIAWWGKHFGEEPPLTGSAEQGAGTIFFQGCNLHCCFCQNWQISQQPVGSFYSTTELSDIFIQLQAQGAINIDLVSPTIWWKPIAEAIAMARDRGLEIPMVWNSNGYEQVTHLRKLEGLVDIYLPDFKYANNELAERYSGIKNYREKALEAISEMLYQTGRLKIEDKLAYRGTLVRHLLLSNAIDNSLQSLQLLAHLHPVPHVSLMSQYNPMPCNKHYPELNRKITSAEWEKVVNQYYALNLEGWVQELESADCYNPDFNQEKPFNFEIKNTGISN